MLLRFGRAPTLSLFRVSARRPFSTAESSGAAKEANNGASQQQKQPESGNSGEVTVEQLKKQVEELGNKSAELKDLLLRQVAETENVRKIGQEQIENAKKFALQSVLKDLIHVFDTMELALSEVKGARDKVDELHDFHTAVQMLEKDMMKILSKHGFERFHPEEGHDFNPQHHDALFVVPADSKEKGNKVVTVVKKGFSLNGRILRASQVGVTKHQ